MVEGAVEFKVHVNVQCIPSEFVVVNFNNVVPGKVDGLSKTGLSLGSNLGEKLY